MSDQPEQARRQRANSPPRRMKREACDLKFPAATSEMKQCWAMLSARARAKLPRGQLAKHNAALQETELNICNSPKRPRSGRLHSLLPASETSRAILDKTGGKKKKKEKLWRLFQRENLHFVIEGASGTEKRGEKKRGRSHEGELSFWEVHWSATRPLPLFWTGNEIIRP